MVILWWLLVVAATSALQLPIGVSPGDLSWECGDFCVRTIGTVCEDDPAKRAKPLFFPSWCNGDNWTHQPRTTLQFYDGNRGGSRCKCSCDDRDAFCASIVYETNAPLNVVWKCNPNTRWSFKADFCSASGGTLQHDGERCTCACLSGHTGPLCAVTWRDTPSGLVVYNSHSYSCSINPVTKAPVYLLCNPKGSTWESLGNSQCRCDCKAGFSGRYCEIGFLPDGTYSSTFSTACLHGTHVAIANTFPVEFRCDCDSGWTDPFCDRKWDDITPTLDLPFIDTSRPGGLPGSWPCTQFNGGRLSPNHCNPAGGTIALDPGSGGAFCGCRCNEGFKGNACSVRSCIAGLSGLKCSGHGTCTTGCDCNVGWVGPTCSVKSICNTAGSRTTSCTATKPDGGLGTLCLQHSCTCNEGFGGDLCCPFASNGKVCDGNPCTLRIEGGSQCTCSAGRLGAQCSGFLCNPRGECDCSSGGTESSARGVRLPLYDGDACCLTAYTSTNKMDRVPCGGRGACVHGTCQCNAGFAGGYCCPVASTGGSIPCNGHGMCTSTGTCACADGYQGTACEINGNCPSNSNGTECSGRGVCVGPRDLAIELARLKFSAGARTAIRIIPSAAAVAGQGTYELALLLWRVFYDQNLTLPTNHKPTAFWQSAVDDPVVAIRSISDGTWLSKLRSVTPRSEQIRTVNDMIIRAYPARSAGDETYATHLLDAFLGADLSERIFAMQALLVYEQFIVFPGNAVATYPSKHRCSCGTPGASGPDCAATCPVISGNDACGGWVFGVRAGICDYSTNKCVCGWSRTGTKCQLATITSGIAFGAKCINGTQNGGCAFQAQVTCLDSTNVQACNGHGSCSVDSANSDASIHCECATAWTGRYCTYSTCSTHFGTEACSGRGTCRGAALGCACDVAAGLASSTSRSVVPKIPIGQECEVLAGAECVSFSNDFGGGWVECNNHGKCTLSTQGPVCLCNSGYGGAHCTETECVKTCTEREFCDASTNGQCVCKPLFSPPLSSCTDFTKPSMCGHGTAALNGSTCICDGGWKKDPSTGLCTVASCPLVTLTENGIRKCVDGETAGCIDQCGTRCTSGPVCTCPRPQAAYDQIGGVCYPKCHGGIAEISNAPPFYICNCGGVIVGAGQFRNRTTCELSMCLNGGTPTLNGCQCIAPFIKPFCGNIDCSGGQGTFNVVTQQCDCLFPFKHATLNIANCKGHVCGAHGSPLTGSVMGCACNIGWSGVTCNISSPLPFSSSSSASSTGSSWSSSTFSQSASSTASSTVSSGLSTSSGATSSSASVSSASVSSLSSSSSGSLVQRASSERVTSPNYQLFAILIAIVCYWLYGNFNEACTIGWLCYAITSLRWTDATNATPKTTSSNAAIVVTSTVAIISHPTTKRALVEVAPCASIVPKSANVGTVDASPPLLV